MSSRRIRSALLRWYSGQKRALPWRETRDPYRIWISEVMLQQTRVETVLPYYRSFLSRFPTVEDLAAAELDRVTNLWAGLGYYSRARNLHAAAKLVAARGGRFPGSYQGLLELPGVGPYTAAAIASIAFGEARCALDGNLERVLSRVFALPLDPKSSAGKAALLREGQALVEAGGAGELNQALMDLANSHCRAKKPDCPACPLRNCCRAFAEGSAAQLPLRRPKPEKLRVDAEAWLVVTGDRLLLARRAEDEWLAGLWDLPWVVLAGAQEKGRTERASPAFGEERGSWLQERTITRHKIRFHVRSLWCARAPSEKQLRRLCGVGGELRWVPLDDLHGVNLPRPSERALERLLPTLN